MVKLTTTNIVGTASKTTWSQAQTVVYSNDQMLMIVLQLACEESDSLVDLSTLGVEIIAEIEGKGQEIESDNQLKSIVDNVVSGGAQGLVTQILVASLLKEKLMIYGVGNVEAYLERGGKLAKLGKVCTGTLLENDTVVVALSKFVEVVSLVKFKEIITQEENPAELLVPLVHTQAETSGVAAIVGVVEKGTSDQEGGFWQKFINPNVKINLRNETPRKTNLLIGSGILVLLIIMIGIGMIRRVKVVSERDFGNVSTSVTSKMQEVLAVGDLNPERARMLLLQAKGEVEAYLTTNITDEYKQKGNKLLDEIALAEEKAFKKNDVQLSTLVELRVLLDGLKSDSMKSDGKGNLIFNDPTSAKIVSMNIVDRSRQMIDAKENKFADIGISDTKMYGLNSLGVKELFLKKTDIKQIIDPDEFWKDPTLIEVFAGNVYVLDKEQGEIWKYPTLGDTFGSRRRWFAAGIVPDLSNVVDMKVVGDVWLLTSTGKLERYSRGAPVAFNMEGFPAQKESKKLSNPTAIWANENSVYVLENGASRVVVFGTDGKYESQYTNSEFANASDLVIVDDKGYVLIDNVVKEFGL